MRMRILALMGMAFGVIATCAAVATGAPGTGPSVGCPSSQTVDVWNLVADLNCDAKSDLIYRNDLDGRVYVLFMDGLSTGGQRLVYTEPDTAWRVIGDVHFMSPSFGDLIWRNEVTGEVSIMAFFHGHPLAGMVIRNGPGEDISLRRDSSWKIVGARHQYGYGGDLIWWNSVTGQVTSMTIGIDPALVAWFVEERGVYQETNTDWKIAAVGNFSGSHTHTRSQLLWRNSSTGDVWLMTMFAEDGRVFYREPNTDWKIVAAADFNGDGTSDIIWRNDVTGQVWMMLVDSNQIVAQGQIYQEPNLAWKIVATGDYNGDGKSDIVWRNESTGQVWMMLMNGHSIASQGPVYWEPDLRWKLHGPWEHGH